MMVIYFNSNRKFYLEKYQGIYFNNYKTNEFTLNYLIGEHEDYVNARKMLREERKDWTNEDYDRLLRQGVKKRKKKRHITKMDEKQLKFEFTEV